MAPVVVRPPKPRVETWEAERWASLLYGLEVVATDLPGEVDRNFLLTAADGGRWVLKAAPPGTVDREIECQLAVLQHLAESELRELVPRLVADRQGSHLCRQRTAADETVSVRIVTYLSGRPLAALDSPTAGLRTEIGRTFGGLDLALVTFDHPGARRHHFWDVVTLLELRPLLAELSPRLRPAVGRGLERFEARVVPYLSELPSSVIHNDGNDYNLLVEETGGGPRLTGIIDFGDMVHTVTVAELAIVSVYAMLGADDRRAAAEQVAAGYESVRPLSDLETEVLPELIVARLCHSLLMSAQARIMAPEDSYLRVSERQAAALLEELDP